MRPSSSKLRVAAFGAWLLATGVSAAAVISYPELPVYEMARAPVHPPAFVRAGARVKDFNVGQAQSGQQSLFRIFDSPRLAAEFSKKGFLADDEVGRKICTYIATESAEFGEPWPAVALEIFSRSPGSGEHPVIALHVETAEGEWTRENGGVLAVVDGWLDLRSRGFALVARSRMQVKQIAEGPFGVRVFAARGMDTVHFVVLPPPLAPEIPRFSLTAQRATLETGGELGASECLHSRVTLEASAGTGSHAVISYQHLQPVPTDPDPSAERGSVPPFALRPVSVHLSAGKNANGASPLASVSFQADPPQSLE